MPIYDNNGTTSYEIGKLYDNDGATTYQIGKVYDNDGTTNNLIYTAELVLFDKDTGVNLLSDGWTVIENYSNLCTQREVGVLTDGYLKMRGNAVNWWRAVWKSNATFDCSSYSKLCFTFTPQKDLAQKQHYAGLDIKTYYPNSNNPTNAVICDKTGISVYAGTKYTKSIDLTNKGDLPLYFFGHATSDATHKDIWLLFEKIWFE